MKTRLTRLLDSMPHRVSMKWLAGLVAWVMVVGMIYLYKVEKFAPMIFLGACAVAMFAVEFKMVRPKSADAKEPAAKYIDLALACFALAVIGLAVVLVTA